MKSEWTFYCFKCKQKSDRSMRFWNPAGLLSILRQENNTMVSLQI